jgi:hypothetical protein
LKTIKFCGSKTKNRYLNAQAPPRAGFACVASQNRQKREESQVLVRITPGFVRFFFRGKFIRRPPKFQFQPNGVGAPSMKTSLGGFGVELHGAANTQKHETGVVFILESPNNRGRCLCDNQEESGVVILPFIPPAKTSLLK